MCLFWRGRFIPVEGEIYLLYWDVVAIEGLYRRWSRLRSGQPLSRTLHRCHLTPDTYTFILREAEPEIVKKWQEKVMPPPPQEIITPSARGWHLASYKPRLLCYKCKNEAQSSNHSSSLFPLAVFILFSFKKWNNEYHICTSYSGVSNALGAKMTFKR